MRNALAAVSAVCFFWTGSIAPLHAGPKPLEDVAVAEAEVEDNALTPLAAELKTRLNNAGKAISEDDDSLIGKIFAFYRTRSFQPLWIIDGAPTRQALDLAEAMSNARRDALDPDQYDVLDLASARQADVAATAEIELAFTLAAARYASHLAAGRIRPRSLSKDITMAPEKPDIAVVLTTLSSAPDAKAALRGFEPAHRQYWALKAKLAELLDNPDPADRPEIPAGQTLRYASRDPRVPVLRQRLGVDFAGDDPEQFDEKLSDAVMAFQKQNGLKPDGIVGRGTMAALNRNNRESLVPLMITNMERWRWLPRDLGALHVAVNIPEYRVRVNTSEKTVHEARVVVGKPSNPTPVFSDEMEHIIVNPSWNVPASIVSKEMMPDILMDPTGFFQSNGYELLARGNGWNGFRKVDPEMVDWFSVDPKSVLVRQPPGRRNALGRIKFMFPNRHAVYLHDTPAKNLFGRDMRAYSHGCVRVQDPMAFADALLINEPDWDSSRLKKLFGDSERQVDLTSRIPVHLTYFTAMVEDDGTVRTFADIYGYDRAMRQLTDH